MCDRKTLLAVSGGIDSMCMAEIFVRRYPCESLAIAHCNFNLRGEESDGDEQLVRRWAEEHGVRIHVQSFDTKGFAREHGVSVEMAARELRYRWFAQLCASEGYDEVAVAHNANDNAETLLLNLLRGSGMKGLAGMSAVSPLPYSEGMAVRLVRPLLDMTRKQIEGFAIANGVRYRNDSTNFSSEYKRNMLRNEVFPVFEKVNPSVVRTLNREMGYFAEANEIVADYCRKEVEDICCPEEQGDMRISYQALLSKKHWRYLLYHILEPYGFNSAVLASIEDLLSSDRTVSGKRFDSKDHTVLMERDHMHVIPSIAGQAGNDVLCHAQPDSVRHARPDSLRRAQPDTVRHAQPDTLRHARLDRASADDFMPVRGAGTYHVNGRAFKIEVLEWTYDMPLKQAEGVLVLDAEKLRFPFVLRGWRDGDWLIPFGMKGKKKVSDLFADLKYDSVMKASAVIIADVQTEGMADARHIAGVAGVRIDDRYKVSSSTRSVIRISVL
ncbi:MAG: tRNA lysidine(34) synthetase TilS [Bacteroidales bacterium]|nr:tRNA lysidine(34) synthetase TilS [Bacteroidales bacterium]